MAGRVKPGGRRDQLVTRAMDRLRREGVPGPCSCGKNRDTMGHNTAKFEWSSQRAAFSPALCPECGKRLPMIPVEQVRP